MKADKLTNLLYFDDFKKEADHIIAEEGTDYILVSMNISNFKYINDVYGYEAGDELLKQLAEYFYFNNPNARLGSRMHADRFVILTDGNADSEERLFQRFFARHAEFSRRMESKYPLEKISDPYRKLWIRQSLQEKVLQTVTWRILLFTAKSWLKKPIGNAG